MDDSSATMTPQRTSPRQQETRHRMLEYLTTSMTPLLQAANDESEDGVLTSDAFPSFEPTSAAEDPKEPSERTTSELEDAKSPRDPSLGHKSFKASTSMTTVTPMKGFDLFSLSMNEIFALFTTLPDAFFPRKRLYLPKLTKTLVLDLDETLIHSNSSLSTGNNSSSSAESTIFNSISQWFNPPAPAYDMMIEVLLNKHSCLYYIRKRPFCDYFLKIVSQWYNLVIFTASLPEYAEPVIDWLDNGARILQKRFYRQVMSHEIVLDLISFV